MQEVFGEAFLVNILTVTASVRKLTQPNGFPINSRDKLTCHISTREDDQWIQQGHQNKRKEREKTKQKEYINSNPKFKILTLKIFS